MRNETPTSTARPLRAVPGLAALVAIALLAGAGPLSAHPAATTSALVRVTAGKPSELRFTLSVKSVKHGTVTFSVTNKGILPHDFKICSSPKGGLANACAGKATPVLAPGKTATLMYAFAKTGTYEYLCTVPGHAAGGMKGDLKVT